MEFSGVGLSVIMALLAVNAIMLIWRPQEKVPENAGLVFTVLEQVGRFASCLLMVLSGQFRYSSQPVWAIAMVVLLILNVWPWARYLQDDAKLLSLMKPLGIIPIPAAVLPIMALLCFAIVQQSPWIGAATAMFAIGHLANSWQMYRNLNWAAGFPPR